MPRLREFLEKINIDAEVAFDAPLAPLTTFRVGGPADLLVAPRTVEGLVRLVSAAGAEGIPLFILGGGANVVVADRGVRGIVAETRLLAGVREEQGEDGSRLLVAEAGLSMDGLCEAALERGLGGLETFYGMPGSVGGAVFMNARCYEVEVADRLAWAECLPLPRGADRDGCHGADRDWPRGGTRGGTGTAQGRVVRHAFAAEEWSYKHSPFQPCTAVPETGDPSSAGRVAGAAILRAAFRLVPGDRAAIGAVMREKRADREAKGHYRLPSAGSTFKNDRRLGKPTGKILDELGLRGRRIGGAMVSEWHANIFVNAGGATAADIAALVELAQREARDRLGVELESEVLFVGEA